MTKIVGTLVLVAMLLVIVFGTALCVAMLVDRLPQGGVVAEASVAPTPIPAVRGWYYQQTVHALWTSGAHDKWFRACLDDGWEPMMVAANQAGCWIIWRKPAAPAPEGVRP